MSVGVQFCPHRHNLSVHLMHNRKETRVAIRMRDGDFRNEELVILLRFSLEPSCASHAPTIITNDTGYGGAVSDTASLMKCIGSSCHFVTLLPPFGIQYYCHTFYSSGYFLG